MKGVERGILNNYSIVRLDIVGYYHQVFSMALARVSSCFQIFWAFFDQLDVQPQPLEWELKANTMSDARVNHFLKLFSFMIGNMAAQYTLPPF